VRIDGLSLSSLTWRDWLTIPNVVTLARFLLIIPVAWLLISGDHATTALILLTVFGLTDWVDGFLARRMGQESAIGALIDPIADRLGVGVVAMALVLGGRLAAWIVVVIVAVDLCLAVTFLIVRPTRHPPVTPLGKVRTALLMAGFVATGLGLVPGWRAAAVIGRILCATGAVAHAVAGLGYFRAMVRSA
jgi:cardiolipin synthase